MNWLQRLFVKHANRRLSAWSWRQTKKPDFDPNALSRDMGGFGPFDWYYGSYRQWWISLRYCAHLGYRGYDKEGNDAEILRLGFSNPTESRRKSKLASELIRRMREDGDLK